MIEITVGDEKVNKIKIGKKLPLVFIGGPCAIESEDHAMHMSSSINEICKELSVPFIYKSCFDKDCRSSSKSFLGLGIESGLDILSRIRNEVKVPVTTDISNVAWVEETAKVVDLLQIPAYLCRQTHLLRAVGETGKPINLKKGQFMSPWNMRNSADKIIETGNDQVILTDRGTFFGYSMLINDYRNFKIFTDAGFPACFDATHSIQLPTSLGSVSGGQREFIPSMVRAAVSAGINVLFMETHDNPDAALSDGALQLNLKYLKNMLSQAKELHEIRLDMIERYGEDNVE